MLGVGGHREAGRIDPVGPALTSFSGPHTSAFLPHLAASCVQGGWGSVCKTPLLRALWDPGRKATSSKVGGTLGRLSQMSRRPWALEAKV